MEGVSQDFKGKQESFQEEPRNKMIKYLEDLPGKKKR